MNTVTAVTEKYYLGYSISFNQKKSRFEARKNRKLFTWDDSIEIIKKSIDRWEANIECSNRIALTPRPQSPNKNAQRKY